MPRFATYIFAFAAFAMCSCESDDDAGYPVRGGIAFRANYLSGSRTTITGTTAAFKSGDQIGITETLTARSNVLYSFNGTAWSTSTAMYWKDRTSTHTFYAYYPYSSASSGTSAAVPVLNSQASAEKVDPARNMLVARPKMQARSGGASVALAFRHAFAMLQFNIYTSIISTVYLNNMTVKGGNSTLSATRPYGIVNTVNTPGNIYYDQADSVIKFPVNSSATFAQSVTKSVPSNSVVNLGGFSAYLLVIPGNYGDPKPQVSFNLTGQGTINTKFAELSVTQFQPGTKYVFKVTIPSGVLSAAGAPGTGHGNIAFADPVLDVGLEAVEPW